MSTSDNFIHPNDIREFLSAICYHTQTDEVKRRMEALWQTEGLRAAHIAWWKSHYATRLRYQPTQDMVDAESTLSDLRLKQSKSFLAITLNPRPQVGRDPKLWKKFIEWVQAIPTHRAWARPQEFEYRIEHRPNQEHDPGSRHIHMFVKRGLKWSPSHIVRSLGRSKKFFNNEKCVFVKQVFDKKGWLKYIRKNAENIIEPDSTLQCHQQLQTVSEPVVEEVDEDLVEKVPR